MARARSARASKHCYAVSCSPPKHRLQNRNRDVTKKHQKETARASSEILQSLLSNCAQIGLCSEQQATPQAVTTIPYQRTRSLKKKQASVRQMLHRKYISFRTHYQDTVRQQSRGIRQLQSPCNHSMPQGHKLATAVSSSVVSVVL